MKQTIWGKENKVAKREKEDQFRQVVKSLPLPLAILDDQDNIQYLNDRFCMSYGYTLDDIPTIGDFWEKAYPDSAKRSIAIRLWDNLLISGKDIEDAQCDVLKNLNIKGKNDSNHEIEISCVPIGKEKKLAIFTDVTEFKKLQNQIKQVEKMEAINTLAGGIAHDFNNLLMGIEGNISLMLLDMDKKNSGYQRLKQVAGYVKRGAELTKQLLGFARGGKYEVRPVRVNEVIQSTVDMFAPTQKHLTIETNFQKDIGAVEADEGQLQQMLLNLFVNAADAMPEGGKLEIVTKNVTHNQIVAKLYHVKPGSYVAILVRDTGEGMEKKVLDRVFEPFFTTKEMGRGTGLGLASAYGIVKGHGGYIEVESELKEGTTFFVYLPVTNKTVSRTRMIEKPAVEGSGVVLLVDDEEMVLDVGQQMLKKLGYGTLIASGGREAIRIYKEKRNVIDIVILDMVMPDLSGGQTYDQLKELNPEIKVLLSSGYSINGQANAIMSRGCDGFIQKPFNLSNLSKKVKEILGDFTE